MSEAIGTLGAVSVEYARKADEYGRLAENAADAEATYKHERAKFIVTARMGDPKASIASLDVAADADERIAGLLRDRLVTAAVLDAAQKKLQQLRERIATGRTLAATEREVDKHHALGIGGGA